MVLKNIKEHLKKELVNVKRKKEFYSNYSNLPTINTTGFSDFFIDQPVNIKFQYKHQTLLVKKKKVYLSLFERTTNFKLPPQGKETKIFGDVVKIDGKFSVHGNLQSELSILFYDGNKYINSKKYLLQDEIFGVSVEVPDSASTYRIAIKLEGNGSFQNKKLVITQQTHHIKQINTSLILSESNSQFKMSEKVQQFSNDVKNYKYRRTIKNNGIRVASILDEFSYKSFKYDCDLLSLSKDNWKRELNEFNPDFLFVESCWQGNDGDWAYEIANLHINKHRKKLKELIDFCKENKIIAIFWDKEGRENFEFFKKAASYFDFIFTTDENNIEKFKKYTKNENVFVLPFAAQPQIHNPIYKGRNYMGKIGFAGSYYSNKHELRKKDIESIIKPSLKYGIHIYDRYFDKNVDEAPNNQWPEDYKTNIVGKLNYDLMVEAYKNYDIFININSVQDSKYMFARRVFEVLSAGTMVISGPSIGVKKIFKELVPVANNPKEAETLFKIYTKNNALRNKLAKAGNRFVLQNHTYKNRLQQICEQIGLEKRITKTKKVTIVSVTNRQEFINDLYQNINSQTYKNIEVVVVLNNNNMDLSTWKNKFSRLDNPVKVFKVDQQQTLGYCLNEAVNQSNGEIIAKFDDDDYYGPNYVTDMILSMDYSNSDIVGKSSHYVYFEGNDLLAIKTIGNGQEAYSDFVAGATLVFKREAYIKLGGFSNKNRGEDSDFLSRAKQEGLLIYSNDYYNYCCIRRADKEGHTWKISDNDLLRSCSSEIFTKDYKTAVQA